jgi:hypothetical protein
MTYIFLTLRFSRLVKIINLIDKTLKWPLLSGPQQDRWVSQSGKLLILGDAAHAMVPYMSQGKSRRHKHYLEVSASDDPYLQAPQWR